MRAIGHKLDAEIPTSAVIRAFLKIEIMKKAGRNISPMPEWIDFVLGPLYSLVEWVLTIHPIFVCKHRNQVEKDRALDEMMAGWNGKASETDFSKFDLTIRLCHLGSEQALCLNIAGELGMHSYAMHAIDLVNKAKIQHVSGPKVSGLARERWSGEAPTSVGNGMINASVIWHAAGKPDLRGLDFPQLPFVVEGDDGFVSPIVAPAALVQSASDSGLLLDVEHGDVVNVGFIGRKFGYVNSTLVTFCDPVRALEKWHLSAQASRKCSPAALMRAKALSYLSTDEHTPIIGALAWACVQRTNHVELGDALRLYRYQIQNSGVPIDKLGSRRPQVVESLVPSVAYHLGTSVQHVRDLHGAWLAWGEGRGPKPRPIRNPMFEHVGCVGQRTIPPSI